ncbi:ATP-binding protein [Streptomyces nanshensis]
MTLPAAGNTVAEAADEEADGAPSPLVPRFAMRFSSTPRGARLARRLVAKRLEQWGCSPESEAYQSMVSIAGELCANAVRHGHVPGRDFRVCLTATDAVLCIEVTDTRGERRPKPRSNPCDAENGRGLLIVGMLADRWAVVAHPPGHPGKTVRAEVHTQPAESSANLPSQTP